MSYFRVVDGEGQVLADCLAERQARRFLKAWSDRPVASDRPALLQALDVGLSSRQRAAG